MNSKDELTVNANYILIDIQLEAIKSTFSPQMKEIYDQRILASVEELQKTLVDSPEKDKMIEILNKCLL